MLEPSEEQIKAWKANGADYAGDWTTWNDPGEFDGQTEAIDMAQNMAGGFNQEMVAGYIYEGMREVIDAK